MTGFIADAPLGRDGARQPVPATSVEKARGLIIVGWKPVRKNTLRGFVDVRLPMGLTIHEIAVHNSNGKTWVSLPSKPIIGADGTAKRDPETGKIRYTPVLEWPNRATADRFSIAVIDALEVLHPGAVRP